MPPPPRGLSTPVDDVADAAARFEPRPQDDGSPGRIIATMIGVVGILLLGSLFWSALGSLFSAVQSATSAIPLDRPTPQLVVTAAPTSLPAVVVLTVPATVQAAAPQPTATALPVATSEPPAPATPEPTVRPTAAPTAEAAGRSPWVLLPQPAPGSSVKPGAVTLEARGRGDADIAEIRLELDGASVPVSFEPRGEGVWRSVASVQVSPGQHAARAVVVDTRGRSGSYRWTFQAAP